MPPVPDATAQPVPLQVTQRASAGPGPSATPHVGRLRGLVRWIIGYGQQLAVSLQQRAAPARFAALAFRFQTTDLGAILARIARGLMLAGALESKLGRLADAGRDLKPDRIRLPSARSPRGNLPARQPRLRPTNIIDLPLDRLPSAEAIAAELRRRPIGAVLADICRDLCMVPGEVTSARWEELVDAVTAYGGSVVPLMFGYPMFEKAHAAARRAMAGQAPDETAWVVPELPPGVAARSTDPPCDARQPIAV